MGASHVSGPLFVGGSPVGMLGVGNVYHVIKQNETFYNQFLADHQVDYPDGTQSVHTVTTAQITALTANVAIQAALDSCVAGRNDYVILYPSNTDYDISVVLSMTKKGVHLISPAGFGYEIGATNATRLHQNASAACINIAYSCIEVAGLYLKNYAGKSAITVATESYACNIHHNFFSVTNNSTTGNEPLISCAGTGGGYGAIVRNRFFDVAGGSATSDVYAISVATGAVGCQVQYNDVTVRLGNTATVVIANNGQAGSCDFNLIRQSGANAAQGTSAGIITDAFSMQTCMTGIGNRCAVATSHVFTAASSAVDTGLVDNRSGLNGGNVTEDTDT